MRNDIDNRIFYWIRSTGLEELSLQDNDKGRRIRAKLRVVHKSLYRLRFDSTSPRMRAKHWRMIHETLGWLAMDAAVFGLLTSDEAVLRMQEEILSNADKEFDLQQLVS